jgi:hypothetical protein
MLYLSRDASAQVLVDPSCSGSGMRHEHSSVIEASNVRELVELQTSVLKHALSYVTRPKTFILTGPILGRLRQMVASDCSSRLASMWYRAIHVGQQVRAC